MSLKYSKAPISELVCGLIFNTNLLLENGVLFKLISELIEDYPIVNSHPAVGEEEVVTDIIQSATDYSKSGFATYRLMSSDGRWQILLQQNLISYHWVRQDLEDVGNYPGFSKVFSRFEKVYSLVKRLVNDPNRFDLCIKSYYLYYADRLLFEEYKRDGLAISDVINLNPPSFTVYNKTYFANNFLCKYSIPCDAVDGYSIVSINSPTIPNIGQILAVDNKIKGYSSRLAKIDDWFKAAHEVQVSFFESIFNTAILEKWR